MDEQQADQKQTAGDQAAVEAKQEEGIFTQKVQKRKQLPIQLKQQVISAYEQNLLQNRGQARKLTLEMFSEVNLTIKQIESAMKHKSKIMIQKDNLQQTRIRPKRSNYKTIEKKLISLIKKNVFVSEFDIQNWIIQIQKALPKNHPDKKRKCSHGYIKKLIERNNFQNVVVFFDQRHTSNYNEYIVDHTLAELAQDILKPAHEFTFKIEGW
ncbi:Hypothetical_protein [Hexamita inflata]|uniref:Hypothetical_protein n=1 Tax=Hexamita inflata TaxID=28002 RepID=A0AA86UIH4_9EUKA|nr:Hypothetical protein HINF_LOCUS40172 [Hexamita inflata]